MKFETYVPAEFISRGATVVGMYGETIEVLYVVVGDYYGEENVSVFYTDKDGNEAEAKFFEYELVKVRRD